jgi:hypothetical protein
MELIMMRNKWMTWTALVGLSLGVTACESVQTGKSGNLVFSYATPDNVADFNKPLAVGAKLDLQVTEAGTGDAVQVESAASDDSNVLAIAQYAGDTIVLEGKSAGTVEITATARVPSGDVVEDAVDFQVAVPEVLKLSHTCTDGSEGHYLVGQDVRIPFKMELRNGRSVIGYGYHPVDIEPAGAAQLDATAKDQRYLRLRVTEEPGTVTLRSQLDETTATLQIVTVAAIDGIAAMPSNLAKISMGGTSYLGVQPTVGEHRVCQANINLEVTTSTPDVCTASSSTLNYDPAVGIYNESSYVAVTGVNPGLCELTASYPDANGGEGVSMELTVEVE